MTTPLTLTVDRGEGGTLALVAAGEIDMSNVGSFGRALDDAIAGNGGEVVTVDLRGVDYLDSGGINVLFTAAEHIRVIVRPLLVPVLTISGLTELTSVVSAPATTDD